jgi:hypothetical protein
LESTQLEKKLSHPKSTRNNLSISLEVGTISQSLLITGYIKALLHYTYQKDKIDVAKED